MINYIPFLKTKTNEFSSIKGLEQSIVTNITPFFDIHRKTNLDYTENEYINFIPTIYKKFLKNVSMCPYFYLDDYDINNDLFVNNEQSYLYVLKTFQNFSFIPVIGIDRSFERNDAVLSHPELNRKNTIALRVTIDDLQTGYIELEELITDASEKYEDIELIIDLKVIQQNANINKFCTIIDTFINRKIYAFSKVIVTGSSIPKIIGDIISPDSTKDLQRKEIEVFSLIKSKYDNLFLGDYTLVSPYYSEFEVDPTMYPNITTAKVIYPYEDRQFIMRGCSIKKKGNIQYKNICNVISQKSFFRGSTYSEGDKFIANAMNLDKSITAASILKPTINAHISYMYKDFDL